MSYAQDVKNELAHVFDDDEDCLRTEFVALLRVATRQIGGRIEFTTSNAAVARRVVTLGRRFFPHINPEVSTVRNKRLRKGLLYVVKFIIAGEVKIFFDTLDDAELLKRRRFKVAYLRGAFLAGGSVNRPEAQYLVQIVSRKASEQILIRDLLSKLEFIAGLSEHDKRFVVWMREGDSVCDFLGMIGATEAVERFEIARNLKEVRAQVNRIVNVETAALNKSINAAQRQLADIKILLDKKAPVKERFREAMQVRLDNPSCTTSELAEKIGMSQPGLVYRFQMIHRLAKKFSRK